MGIQRNRLMRGLDEFHLESGDLLEDNPEKRLFYAMLVRAYVDYLATTRDIKRRHSREAEAWIFATPPTSDPQFCFVWICQQLDLDPLTVREKFKADYEKYSPMRKRSCDISQIPLEAVRQLPLRLRLKAINSPVTTIMEIGEDMARKSKESISENYEVPSIDTPPSEDAEAQLPLIPVVEETDLEKAEKDLAGNNHSKFYMNLSLTIQKEGGKSYKIPVFDGAVYAEMVDEILNKYFHSSRFKDVLIAILNIRDSQGMLISPKELRAINQAERNIAKAEAESGSYPRAAEPDFEARQANTKQSNWEVPAADAANF